jgi:hypothetical protein
MHTDRKSRLLTLIHLDNMARINKPMTYYGVTPPRERIVRYRIRHWMTWYCILRRDECETKGEQLEGTRARLIGHQLAGKERFSYKEQTVK